jgi:hypothetical protein
MKFGDISGSHGDEYKGGCLLGCYAPCTPVEINVSEIFAASSVRAMTEAVSASETSVNFYQNQSCFC